MKRFLLVCVTAVILSVGPSAFAETVDLVGSSSDTLNGALYLAAPIAPAGSGVFETFVKLIENDGFLQGYNTDGRPLQYDENNAGPITRSLLLSAVPTRTFTGFGGLCSAGCKEFVLDINQSASDPLLTLNRVYVSLRPAGDLLGGTQTPETRLGASGGLFTDDTPVYDSGAGNQIQLSLATIGSGSGKGDMFLYIPLTAFTGANQFVYLYSELGSLEGDVACADGATTPSPETCYAEENGGFTEWGVRTGTSTVPEPTSLVLLGVGLVGLAAAKRRKL